MAVLYYLSQVLPFVLLLGGLFLAIGHLAGWLLWGRYPRRAMEIESQNDTLRKQLGLLHRTKD